jgi:hypothetical protein
MSSQNVIAYTLLSDNTCYKFNDFIIEVNKYVSTGYNPYGNLISIRESERNNCIMMIQPMIKYGPINSTAE